MTRAAYMTRHYRVLEHRGPASAQACVDCSNPARDCSQIAGTSGEDPEDYEPRCRPCHSRYDGVPQRMSSREISSETLLRMSAAQRGKELSTEHRQKLSEAAKKHTRTPEHQAALTASQWGRKFTEDHRAALSRAAKARNERGTMKVLVERSVEVSEDDRAKIAQVLGQKAVTREEIKDFLWLHGANWTSVIVGSPEPTDGGVADDEDLI